MKTSLLVALAMTGFACGSPGTAQVHVSVHNMSSETHPLLVTVLDVDSAEPISTSSRTIPPEGVASEHYSAVPVGTRAMVAVDVDGTRIASTVATVEAGGLACSSVIKDSLTVSITCGLSCGPVYGKGRDALEPCLGASCGERHESGLVVRSYCPSSNCSSSCEGRREVAYNAEGRAQWEIVYP